MFKFLRIFLLVGTSAVLISCTCATPLKVSEIQKSDKKLACKDVILEINESEHYRDLAKSESGIGFGNMLMPVCWVSSYVDAGQAVKAADTRIAYLGHIYDVLDCGGKSDTGDKDKLAAAAAAVAPPIIQLQPMPAPQAPVIQQPIEKQEPEIKKQSANSVKQGQCVAGEDRKKYTHQHVDKLGRVYIHCHYNTGPHRHIDD